MTYNILAINPGHNGSAALIKDGILDVYIEEERLSRFKRDGNPFRAMLKIMDKNHVDLLIIGGTGQEEHRLPWTGDDSYSALVKKFYPQAQVVKMGNEHHLQHAASAFYGSGFDEAVALVVDGCGSLQDIKLDNEEQNNKIQSYETESIYKCTFPGDIQPLFKRYSHNFGYAMNETIDGIQYDVDGAITTVKSYEAVTQYLGWGPIEAGKTMGLAPYGKKDPKIPQLLREGGRGDKNVFVPNYPAGAWIDTKRYGYLDYDGEDNTEWHYNKNKVKSVQKNIAWAVQEETQQYVGDLIERAVDMTGENNIVISGGYGLNVIANYYFKERFPELNIYIDPICHDGGTVVGAGKLFAHQQIEQHNQKLKEHNETDEPLKEHPKDPLTTLYLGSEYKYTPDDLKKYGILKDEGEGLINVTDVTAADVAKLIKDRKIVSIYQGRAEAGPRALGNRSILYDPTDPNGKDFVNNVKGREWFRPFAGSILQEHAAEWFDMRGLDETPYMMYAMEMQDAHIGDLPSITHVDGTCRIQTVTQEQNKNYYDLINEFYKLSGVPILFNTSFNLGGQPLVDTLDDAITTLFNSQLEYLYLPEIGKLVFLSNERSNLRPRGKDNGKI
jgi:carbamoyltransferase